MILHYEGMEIPVTLYKDDEVINDLNKLEEFNIIPRGGDNVYLKINGSYYFYETPWEYEDMVEFEIEFEGRKIPFKGIFKNKTNQIFIKRALSSAG